MNAQRLRIIGSGAKPYALGHPMFVYDGDTLLATLEPIPLLKNGTEVHIESFNPTRIVREEQRHVGRLIFLEICDYIAENFPQIQAISFAFTRQVNLLGGGVQQAASRAETMERIGAINVRITPKANAVPGHFVVSGIWAYSQRNLRALRAVLEEERAVYIEQPIGSQPLLKTNLRSALRRVFRPLRQMRRTLCSSCAQRRG